MKNYLKIRWLALLLVALSITACEKCKDDPPDLCAVKSPFKADFRIYEVLSTRFTAKDTVDVPIMMDTIFREPAQLGGNLTFEAIGTYDSVKWQVGTDTQVFTNTKFSLSFTNLSNDADVSVRLIGYKKSDKTCFPNDDGIDTVFKKFVITQVNGYSPLLGKFKLLEEVSNRPDTAFICEFNYSTFPYRDAYYMSNFPRGNNALDSISARGNSYRASIGNPLDVMGRCYSFNLTRGFGGLVPRRTFGWLNKTQDTLRLEVERYDSNSNIIKTRWIGIPSKLNLNFFSKF